MDKNTPKIEEVQNIRMKAYIHSGGSFSNPGGHYTNIYFTKWLQDRWSEWETLVQQMDFWKQSPYKNVHAEKFDLWLMQNYGEVKWHEERYKEPQEAQSTQSTP